MQHLTNIVDGSSAFYSILIFWFSYLIPLIQNPCGISSGRSWNCHWRSWPQMESITTKWVGSFTCSLSWFIELWNYRSRWTTFVRPHSSTFNTNVSYTKHFGKDGSILSAINITKKFLIIVNILFFQSTGVNTTDSLAKYEQQLKKLDCLIEFHQFTAFVPSFLERYPCYIICLLFPT